MPPVSLDAAFYAIRAAVPGMAARNWGRIINLASAHELRATPYKSAYVAAKHGLVGLSETVRSGRPKLALPPTPSAQAMGGPRSRPGRWWTRRGRIA